MKQIKNEIGQYSKSHTLKLGLAAVLLTTGLALASHGDGYGYQRGAEIAASGHVEVVHQVPGGVITVGVEIGRPRPVVVQPQPTVVVERECPRPREVTIIHEEPRRDREVTVVRTVGHGHGSHEIVEVRHVDRDGYSERGGDRHEDWRDDGFRSEREAEFRHDGRRDSHDYEDAHQVSVQDNRNGQQRNFYARK